MSKPTQQTPTKCVLYTRVSTGRQAESGLGLEAQLARCRKIAEEHGYEIVDALADPAISGKDGIEERPGLKRVIELAARNPDMAVVTYSLSRLARRQSLTWALLDERGEYRLQVVSATEPFDVTTTMGRVIIGVIAIFCQLEADLCSERTSAALQARKARGLPLGRRPVHVTDPATCLKIRALWATRRFSFGELATEADRLGLPTQRGGKWQKMQIRRIVNGPEPVVREAAAQ